MVRACRLIVSCFGLLSLMACSGADVINALVPHDGYRVTRNISYGEDVRQKLDIYVPDDHGATHKVIVFFYGGSWQKGTKDDFLFVAQAFASRGYITVVADYRIYPDVYFPAFMHDGAAVFRWVHDHIATYGGDVHQLYLAGHSAGAYIAVMLATNHEYLTQAGARASWIKGVIGIAGPYDFLPFIDDKIRAIFSQLPEIESQPIHFVKPHLPPMLLMTGSRDPDVLPRNTINFSAKLRTYGNEVEELIFPNVEHIGIILALADGFRSNAPVLDSIDRFILKNN